MRYASLPISQWKTCRATRASASPELPCSQEEDTAHGQVGEQHEEPHGGGEGVEEGEVARLAALMRRDRDGQSDGQTGARRQGATALHCTTRGQCPSLYFPTKSLQCCCSSHTLMPQSIDSRSRSGRATAEGALGSCSLSLQVCRRYSVTQQ